MWPRLFQFGDRPLDHARVVERALREPAVEMDAEVFEVLAAIGQLLGQHVLVDVGPLLAEQILGGGDQAVEMRFELFFLGRRVVAVVRPGRRHRDRRAWRRPDAHSDRRAPRESARPFRDVAALVGIGRKRHRLAERSEVAQPGGHRQDVHLPPGIIDVVLAAHLVAGEGQQAGQAGAVGRAAAVADMQRAGRIGGNELHLHLATGRLTPAVVVAACQHRLDHAAPGRRRQPEVDEAGAGDFRLRQPGRHGQFARPAARRSCADCPSARAPTAAPGCWKNRHGRDRAAVPTGYRRSRPVPRSPARCAAVRPDGPSDPMTLAFPGGKVGIIPAPDSVAVPVYTLP